jgi:LPXTG-site transpeptidase (sortase) family protein
MRVPPAWRQPSRHLRRRPRPAVWTLTVPAIGVSAKVITLGGARTGDLAVPPLADVFDTGWYKFTAAPGTAGNSVIAGHVDTYRGPAVFYDLYLLRPGDPVYVGLGAHDRQRYIVRWVKEVSKANFPMAEVFGQTTAHRLWLITCGGSFDYATRHYLDNIIVAAGQPAPKSAARQRRQP